MTDLEKNAGAGGGPDVYLTVDVEPDCPPYLWTWRGIVEGMPALMEVLDREQVPVTFFTTGATAQAGNISAAGAVAKVRVQLEHGSSS